MAEFLRIFENRGIKIAPVNAILLTKSNNLFNFLSDVGVRRDIVGDFPCIVHL